MYSCINIHDNGGLRLIACMERIKLKLFLGTETTSKFTSAINMTFEQAGSR